MVLPAGACIIILHSDQPHPKQLQLVDAHDCGVTVPRHAVAQARRDRKGLDNSSGMVRHHNSRRDHHGRRRYSSAHTTATRRSRGVGLKCICREDKQKHHQTSPTNHAYGITGGGRRRGFALSIMNSSPGGGRRGAAGIEKYYHLLKIITKVKPIPCDHYYAGLSAACCARTNQGRSS